MLPSEHLPGTVMGRFVMGQMNSGGVRSCSSRMPSLSVSCGSEGNAGEGFEHANSQQQQWRLPRIPRIRP